MSAAAAAPEALPVVRETIPAALRTRDRWLCWRYEWRGDRWTKVPFRTDGCGRASATDPASWSTFTAAWAAYGEGGYDGIGFALGDGIIGIDHDHAYDPVTHALSSGAQEWAALGAYREMSPSGSGIHDLILGTLPDDPGRRGQGRRAGPLEVYGGERYLTVTGHVVPGSPADLPIAPAAFASLYRQAFPPATSGLGAAAERPTNRNDAAIIDMAMRARNGDRFTRLWGGDTSDHGGDESAADLALLSHLSFYTPDPAQLDRLFRQSGLMREKWERADYRERTIARALERDEFYQPGERPPLTLAPPRASAVPQVTQRPWPTLDPAALHGLAGDIARAIDPISESDLVATLTTFAAMFGNAVGRGPHYIVSESRHHANIFPVLVGATSKGRKGTSHAAPRRIVSEADPAWAARLFGGIGSGEGLIYAIRDPVTKVRKGEEVIEDDGVQDKRILDTEEELSSLFNIARRDGSTASETVRSAWDGRPLGGLTKNSPTRCAEPHVSIIGHITQTELLKVLDETAAANGLGNRFLWLAVRRSKLLPEPGSLPDDARRDLVHRTQQALSAARKVGRMTRDAEARDLWATVYATLSAPGVGLAGALTDRAEAQTLRLSMIYALLDGSGTITADHLESALAVWQYAAESAAYLFGDKLGDAVADRILAELRSVPRTQNELYDLFGRHVRASRIGTALDTLAAGGHVRNVREETGGRPRTLWEVVT